MLLIKCVLFLTCLLYLRENGDQAGELLERQGDLIRYLREHNAHLGLKVIQLSARLNGDQD